MTAAVITGASAGLGAEFTRQLVAAFPEIEEFWLIARRVGKLEELAQQFPEKKFVCIGLNLLDPKSFRYLGEKLQEQRADVRLLVNNAGCGTTGNLGADASSADGASDERISAGYQSAVPAGRDRRDCRKGRRRKIAAAAGACQSAADPAEGCLLSAAVRACSHRSDAPAGRVSVG